MAGMHDCRSPQVPRDASEARFGRSSFQRRKTSSGAAQSRPITNTLGGLAGPFLVIGCMDRFIYGTTVGDSPLHQRLVGRSHGVHPPGKLRDADGPPATPRRIARWWNCIYGWPGLPHCPRVLVPGELLSPLGTPRTIGRECRSPGERQGSGPSVSNPGRSGRTTARRHTLRSQG